ncbi:MAG: hypothetical protein CO108_16830 [Deltaproteobacteria bacterium CG_4_9_14_3_um_filter_63_12]|nr:MAG: hypothetical protein CO108_16830 [Deltaproteobacteria bacterium CG_4_9_14_3_um_filter_63_12]
MPIQDPEERKRQLEREARAGRTSLAAQIAQNAAGVMKGASPVPALEQATNELCLFLHEHVKDPSGALIAQLERLVKTNGPLVDRHLEEPLSALSLLVEDLVGNEVKLVDFVREVDMRWGQLMKEKPHFDVPGEKPDEDDEYTHDSVRASLVELLLVIEAR